MDLKQLLKRLDHYKHTNPDLGLDYYEIGRHTYCNLLYLDPKTKKAHKFEVRSYSYDMLNNVLSIHVVNWTMCAGTASLTLKNDPEELKKWVVAEDNDTTKVLYGK